MHRRVECCEHSMLSLGALHPGRFRGILYHGLQMVKLVNLLLVAFHKGANITLSFLVNEPFEDT